MKRLLILPVMLLVLAGCAQVGSVISTATKTVTNPVTQVDIYRVKNVYAATLELAVKYREYCWSQPYAALMADRIARPVCQDRRLIVRRMQTAQVKARSAINSADNFARQNPTVNAYTAVSAAWAAVTDFQNTVPKVN